MKKLKKPRRISQAGQTKFICKCECGGNVRGVYDFRQWFTWCTKCTPVVKVQIPGR